jgi:hypothetical protein
MPWVRREAFPLGFPWDRGELSFTPSIRITASRTPHDFTSGSRQADGERSFVLTNQVRLLWGRWPICCLHWCELWSVPTSGGDPDPDSQDPYVFGHPDPHPDPLVRSTDPDPSIIKNSMENLDIYCFLISLWLFIFEEWCNCTSFPNPDRMF